MSPLPSTPRGMYFEEFQPGQRITSAGRTVTEADIVNFAGLSGDFTQIHTDAEYAKNTMMKQRVAHGILVLAIASGLAIQTGVLEGTVILFREISEWKFTRTVFIGDTVHVEMEVKETKEIRRLGGGSVVIDLAVKNQNGEVVMHGMWNTLVASRPV